MQKIGSWRRFQPRLRGRLNDATIYEAQSVYAQARHLAIETLQAVTSRRYRPDDPIKRSVRASAKLRDKRADDSASRLALLILQAPSAVRAQREMDKHRGGYKNRQARLFELIDFNDTFVETVLSLSPKDKTTFVDRLKMEIDFMCDHLGTPTLSDKQYEAIVHGLSREIAVFEGARKLGYIARMTSRVQDAKGVDMVLTDPETKKSLGIDIKTRSAYHFRLINLQRQKRIDEARRLECELAGFCTVTSKHRGASETLLFRIATDDLGPIENFAFRDVAALGAHLANAFSHHGKYLVGTD